MARKKSLRPGLSLGLAIRRQRQALGLSQSLLAKRASVSQPYLSQLEADTRRHVSVGISRRLADALGVPLTDLLDKETPSMPRKGRTEVWLHQMRERADWSWSDYCRDVREGRLLPKPWDESSSMIYRLGGRLPQPGDLLVLFFAPTGTAQAGLCGVGVVTEFSNQRQLRFRALPPTESLQQQPRWSSGAQRWVQAIRVGTVSQGTMWRVTRPQHVGGLLGEIFQELSGAWLKGWALVDPRSVSSAPSARAR